MRTVKVYQEAWPLHTPFVISRGTRSEAMVVVVSKGWVNVPLYPPSVRAQIATIISPLEKGMTRSELQQALPAGAARNAVDSALWDLEARSDFIASGGR